MIYFSANDNVYDWAFAFLESVRSVGNSPVSLIPFSGNCSRLLALRGRYGFDVFDHLAFPQLERIGQDLECGHTPHGRYWFRRFAAFWGRYEHFVYLDCRTLVLSDLTEMVEAPAKFGFDLLHYDCALDQVYEIGSMRRGFLLDGKARGFNSGRWASRQGLFTLEELQQYSDECQSLRQQMNPRNTDQFFLNYCCDRKGIRTGHFAEVLGDMCQYAWARQTGHVYRDSSVFRRWDHGGLAHRKRVPILHWAGIGLSPAMPEAELFYSFRDREFGFLRRLARQFSRMTVRPLFRLAAGLRRNRQLNRTWHWIRRTETSSERACPSDPSRVAS